MSLKFRVVSDSMSPLIKIHDELSVLKKDNYSTFDIILFKRNDKLIVHYVWRNQLAHNNTVITRSLKNIFVDEEPVSLDEILGLVINFKIGFLTRLIIYLRCRLAI